ncbi:MAG: hypothetical protein RLY97_899 [Pseudomonadota bacterium]
MTGASEWTGGLPLELDFMFAGRPEDPEMRESASIWLFEENGAFALPRNGIEAQGAVWDNHRFDCNFALNDGRVLRESTRAATRSAMGHDGKADTLATGPFALSCIEPFHRWQLRYDGAAYVGDVQGQISRDFAIYAEGQPYDHPRVAVVYDVEITMAAPAWVQDYRVEKLMGMSAKERDDAGSMGYGYRIEQLFRATGTLTLDGQSRAFNAVGNRIHRQSVRPMGAFRGHCWQAALFPDGRGFGTIAYPLRDGEVETDRYNIGYVVENGVMYPAYSKNIPFLRNIMPRGDDVSFEMHSELGVWQIGGTTELATFHLGNPGVNGFNNQQSGVRYRLDGMAAFGMIERSSPADLCTIIAG